MDIFWKIFIKTGDVRYYNLYKKLEGKYGSKKDRGNSNKWN